MTTFEIIILAIFYIFCYGYVSAIFIKEENILLRIIWVIMSFALAIYAPVLIGRMLYEKLNKD